MPSKDNPLSRRDFLTLFTKGSLVLSSLVGAGMVLRFLGYQTEPVTPTRFDLGEAANYPPGSRTPIPQAQAVLIHNAQGLVALSLICPHLGCTVNLEEDGFACPCHGSRYYLDGNLRNGPSDKPLRQLRLEISGDQHLILHTD